ncbi:head-tail connector protein [Rhodoligotrophos defluvii]|uniref:head-tail connector protein n=1 Tax=Rhodoligotrophos defluvii TaxID=2561934 RepID=UPI0010C95AD0|nr:head-tail connector protein [Rhodoligotrophos defluvii]
MHRPVLITPPATSPVSLEEAKVHLRVEHGHEDGLIIGLIATATELFDGWTGILGGRCLVEQVWRQDFDGFARVLPLLLGPVIGITSATWRNAAGQIATVNSSDYGLKTDPAGRSYLRFKDGFSFPSDLYETGAVAVTYSAGYPTVGGMSTIPVALKQAMLQLIAYWYDHRAAVVVGTTPSEMPFSVAAMITPYRWLRV